MGGGFLLEQSQKQLGLPHAACFVVQPHRSLVASHLFTPPKLTLHLDVAKPVLSMEHNLKEGGKGLLQDWL